MKPHRSGKFITWLLTAALALAALALAACTKSAEPTPAPTVSQQETRVPQSTQAPEGAETPLPLPAEPTAQEPTSTPTPAAIPSPIATATNTPTPVPPTPTPRPTSTATPKPLATATPSPTPVPTPLGEFTVVDDFGFTLRIDGQVDVQSAGWTESEPSASQGQIQFPYSGVTAILIWLPAADYTPRSLLEETYATLQATQPSVTFTAVSQGDIEVSGQSGVFGGFSASSGGAVVGGGLIGAWLCPGTDTAYTLTVTGTDSATVQIRFQRLLANFKCAP